MKVNVSLIKYSIYFILMSLITVVVNNSFMGYMNIKLDYTTIIITIALIYFILYIFYINSKYGILSLLVIFGMCFLYLYKKKLLFYSYNTILDSIKWFSVYVFEDISVNSIYAKVIIIIFIILISNIVFYFTMHKKRILFLFLAGIIYFSSMWFYGYDDAFYYVKQFLFIFIVLYGFHIFDLRDYTWKQKGYNYSGNITLILIICTIASTGIIFFITAFMPKDIKAIDITWISNNIINKFEQMYFRNYGGRNSLNEDFSMSSVGFQEDPERLGGAVNSSTASILFKVKVEGDTNFPLYLRGSIKDFYTGSSWENGSSIQGKYITDKNIDISFDDDTKVNNSDYIKLTIYPKALKTPTIFSLWKPVSIENSDKSFSYDSLGEIKMTNKYYFSKPYIINCLVPNVYEDELKMVKNNTAYSDNKYLLNNIPSRVRNLAYAITQRYNNNYDKVIAIQKYLKTNYPYSLQTSELPEGRDFVEYFLFDEKKGYCTYYASAMTVMCRILRIPARYVEGVVIDKSDVDSEGLYTAISSKAHAWTEVYFNGYGWIKFEPTASFSDINHTRPIVNNEEVNVDEEVINPADNIPKNKEEEDLDTDYDSNSAPVEKNKIPIYLYILVIALIMIVLKIAINITINKRKFKNIDKLGGRLSAIEFFKLFEKKMKQSGIKRDINETPAEYAVRINNFAPELKIDVINLMNYFNIARYSDEISFEYKSIFKNAIRETDKYIKKKRGYLKYIYYKYVLF